MYDTGVCETNYVRTYENSKIEIMETDRNNNNNDKTSNNNSSSNGNSTNSSSNSDDRMSDCVYL